MPRTFRLHAEPAMTFVVFASAKSGTTWTQRLLCAHPRVHCTESRSFGEQYNPSNPSGLHISTESFVKFLSRHFNEPVDSGQREAFYRDLLFNVVDAFALTARAASGKPIVGEKLTPFPGAGVAAKAIERLHQYHPGLKFVHLVRDGRDVAVSGFVQRANSRIQNYATADAEPWRRALEARRLVREELHFFADLWRETVTAGIAARALFANYLELRYEDLLTDPAAGFGRLLEHIGADHDASTVERCLRAASFDRLSGGREAGEEDNTSFFRKGVAGDWVNWFDADDLAAFESRAGAALRALGYPDGAGDPAARGAGAGTPSRASCAAGLG